MKITKKLASILCQACVIYAVSVTTGATASLALEEFNGGFFSLKKPRGWQIVTGGACSTFAFILRDPALPLRQVFYFSEISQVYSSQQRKALDYQYRFPYPWIDMPVVDPPTPSNFLRSFEQIAHTKLAHQFIQNFPELENLQIVSTKPQSGFIGGSTELIRALFTKDGQVGDGLFLVTVVPAPPLPGVPGFMASGMNIVGISAPKVEFPRLEQELTNIAQSFKISPSYVNDCLRQQAAAYGAISEGGRALSEASDLIADGWARRNRAEDITAEKMKDALRDTTRLYNPETKDVYEFPTGFNEKYELERNHYDMNNLQPLPSDDYDLWNKAPKDGLGSLH